MSLCSDPPSAAVSGGGSGSIGGEEFMLFGVRVKVDPMRKSVSMNNLSEYEPVSNTSNPGEKRGNELPQATAEGGGAAGYASADDAVPRPSIGSRERKRGIPWTEEEHKLFLVGLKKVGKGDWRGISRNYVKTRTPTQVASHAQKYFLRRSNITRRRRRSSLFDITTDSVTAVSEEEGRNQQDSPAEPVPQPTIEHRPVVPFPVTGAPVLLPMQGGNPIGNPALFVCPVPVLPVASSSTMLDLNINQPATNDPSPLSLSLSLSSWQDQSLTRDSAFQAVSGFKNGDGTISVA